LGPLDTGERDPAAVSARVHAATGLSIAIHQSFRDAPSLLSEPQLLLATVKAKRKKGFILHALSGRVVEFPNSRFPRRR